MLRRLIGFVGFVLALAVCAFDSVSATANAQEVLLVSAQSETSALLSHMITACGMRPVVVEKADYTPAMAAAYDYFVLEDAAPLDDLLPAGKPALCVGPSFADRQWIALRTLRQVTKATMRVYGAEQTVILQPDTLLIADNPDGWDTFGSLGTGGTTVPMGVAHDGIYYLPTLRADNLTVYAAAQMMNRYLGLQDGGKLFITLDSVTPLHDPAMLEQIAERMYQSGIPFIATLRPVYYNTDYPSFVRYCNALLYMGSRGASFVMQDPLETGNELVGDSLETRLTKAYSYFADYGVHVAEQTGYPLPVSQDFLLSLTPQGKVYIDLPMNMTIVYTVFRNERELDSAVGSIRQMWFQLGDYSQGSAYKSYTPWPVDEDYVYRSSAQQRFVTFMSQGNSVLRMVVAFFGVIIIALLFLGWRLYRGKFIKHSQHQAERPAAHDEP